MSDKKKSVLRQTAVLLLPFAVFVFSISVGRYPVSVDRLFGSLWAQASGAEMDAAQLALVRVRLPRNIVAMMVGAALSASGAVYQGLFKNPVVSPDLLGATSGASFGAALSILLGAGAAGVHFFSFLGGVTAVALVAVMNGVISKRARSAVNLILCGMLISSLFGAFVSFTKFVADTETKLPAITFWLMGSLSSVTLKDLHIFWLFVPVCTVLVLVRWKINILSLGDGEAKMLGVSVNLYRCVIIACATLLTSLSVSVCGNIGWVGLIVPHFARMVVGSGYVRLLPASILIGGAFMLLVDTAARVLYTVEIPLSIITAVIGAPFFFFLLARSRKVSIS